MEWHEHADIKAEFPRVGCGHHDHDGHGRHYHYITGERIDWRDELGVDHGLRRPAA